MSVRFCPNCSVAVLQTHPEQPKFHLYLKCPVCGYTEKIKTPEKSKP